MKKHILALTLAVLLTVTLCTACANTNGNVATADHADKKIYLITMDKMDQHWVSVDSGAKAMASQLGVTYKWDAPDKKDNARQIEIINNAVAEDADLILLAANDQTAISTAVQNAIDQGVKIIYVDSPADVEAITTLSTDNTKAGEIAAQTMLEELKKAGITSGKIGIIGVNLATNSTISREKGFRDVIKADGRFTLLTTEYKEGDFQASQDAANGFITGNSDLVGIFGTNEGATVGTGNAIKASGKPIIGIGFDRSDTIQNLLNEGHLKAAMAQNPYTMGYLGMAQAFAALTDASTGPEVIDTGVAVLRGKK